MYVGDWLVKFLLATPHQPRHAANPVGPQSSLGLGF
jgi:hypothetical protein